LSAKHARLAAFLESDRFTVAITALILLNAVTLGLETSATAMERFGGLLKVVDTIILLIFTIEIAAKLYVYRAGFFRSGWNIFDFLIVAIAWLPATNGLSILRALRILRVLRLLGQHPDPNMQEWFGTIGASAYTLFQIMTLESWSMGVVRPTMELFPYAWVFFVPFIIVTSFAVLNLFIGIIVDAMQTAHATEDEEAGVDPLSRPATGHDIRALEERFDRLEEKLVGRAQSGPTSGPTSAPERAAETSERSQ
jgi:voltage-gated sodium channel